MSNSINPQLNDIIDCLYRVSAKAITLRDRKLLVVKETEGWYSLPGGGIDHGAEIETTLAREFEEEIGLTTIDLDIDPKLAYFAHHEIHHGIPRVQLFYKVDLRPGAEPDQKELSFKWVDRAEFETLAVSPAVSEARDFILSLF